MSLGVLVKRVQSFFVWTNYTLICASSFRLHCEAVRAVTVGSECNQVLFNWVRTQRSVARECGYKIISCSFQENSNNHHSIGSNGIRLFQFGGCGWQINRLKKCRSREAEMKSRILKNWSQDQKTRMSQNQKARARIQWTRNPAPDVQSQKFSESVKSQWTSQQPAN